MRGKTTCAEGSVLHAEVKKSSKGGGPGQWSAWKATEMAKVFHKVPRPCLGVHNSDRLGCICVVLGCSTCRACSKGHDSGAYTHLECSLNLPIY